MLLEITFLWSWLHFRCHSALGGTHVNAQEIVLSPEEQAELSRRVRSATISQRDRRRARVILLAAQGFSRGEIARLTGFSLPTITCWCQRFQMLRLGGLLDKPGRGRKSPCRLTPCVVSLSRLLSRESASLEGAVGAWRESQGSRPPACTDSGPPMT